MAEGGDDKAKEKILHATKLLRWQWNMTWLPLLCSALVKKIAKYMPCNCQNWISIRVSLYNLLLILILIYVLVAFNKK